MDDSLPESQSSLTNPMFICARWCHFCRLRYVVTSLWLCSKLLSPWLTYMSMAGHTGARQLHVSSLSEDGCALEGSLSASWQLHCASDLYNADGSLRSAD